MFPLFPILLFLLGVVILCGGPVAFSLQSYFKNRGRRSVVCPGNHLPETVEVDRKFSFHTALRGQEHTRLESCSRWPEKGECGQECLVQVDATPENIDRFLKVWIAGKACGICGRLLTVADWRPGRLAVLDENSNFFEMRQLPLDRLPFALEGKRPLCWPCHQEERVRQAQPHRILKGERQPVNTAFEN
jgi:hypothetical protein